jgi:Fe-S-cluster-containing hydrogenase component 2
MRSNVFFFSRKLCTGCLLCEMTCSLIHKGECSRNASFIKVSLHPYSGAPAVSLSMGCDCPDGGEKCLDICNQQALRSVKRDASTGILTEVDWLPCPVVR